MSSSNKVALAKLCKRHYHALHLANHIHCYLSAVFKKNSTRKTKQSVAFGLLLLTSMFTTPVSAQLVFGVDICDRAPQVQRAILEIVGGSETLTDTEEISNCSEINTDLNPGNLAAIPILNLSNRGITSLKSGDFDNLSGLASLRLQGNPITTLFPTGALIEIDVAPFGNLPGIPFLLVGNTEPLDVSGAFISKDAMGSERTISFSVTPTDTAVAGATPDEAVATLTATGTGSTTISVIADDGVGSDTTRIVAVTN